MSEYCIRCKPCLVTPSFFGPAPVPQWEARRRELRSAQLPETRAKGQRSVRPLGFSPVQPAKRHAQQQAAAQQQQQQQTASQEAQASVAQQWATYNKAFSACMEGKGYAVK
jgi:hypothetical protein